MCRTLRRPLCSGERGAAAVEMGVLTAVLLLLAVATVPLFQLLLAHIDLGRGAADGLRYATKARANPCSASDPACEFEPDPACRDLRRRPSAAGTQRYVRQALADPTVSVTVHQPDNPTALREPCAAAPGSRLAVTVTDQLDLGVLAAVANAASSLVGNAPMFPDETVTVSTTAVGYLE